PTGTMANLAAVLAHTRRGDEVILEAEAHIFYYEAAGLSVAGGLMPRPLPGHQGALDPADVAAAIRPDDVHFPRTGLVCLENTHNRAGGTVISLEQTRAVCAVAHAAGVPVHVDGARIFNAALALGVDAATLVADADSVSFCLSKSLSAPVGSLIVGTREFIGRARRARKMLGGGMRQAGVIAAARRGRGPGHGADQHGAVQRRAERPGGGGVRGAPAGARRALRRPRPLDHPHGDPPPHQRRRRGRCCPGGRRRRGGELRHGRLAAGYSSTRRLGARTPSRMSYAASDRVPLGERSGSTRGRTGTSGWPAKAGSRRTRPFHARGPAAHPGSAGWPAPPPRRPPGRTPVRSPRHGSSGPPPPSPGP